MDKQYLLESNQLFVERNKQLLKYNEQLVKATSKKENITSNLKHSEFNLKLIFLLDIKIDFRKSKHHNGSHQNLLCGILTVDFFLQNKLKKGAKQIEPIEH